jgi:hypothetical protein
MHSFERFMGEFDVLQQNVSYSNSNVEYVGYAAPGTDSDKPNWIVIKFFYDSSDNFLKKRFADNVTNFTVRWSKRTTYTYSD